MKGWPGEKRGGAEGLGVGVMTASKKVPGASTMGVGESLAGVESRDAASVGVATIVVPEKTPGALYMGVGCRLAG